MSRSVKNRSELKFFWNGRQLSAFHGDSVAAALARNGISTIARSRKMHRPLGYSGSYISGVLARVDGIPNVRLDGVDCTSGLHVESQNVWPYTWLDILPLARLFPDRWFYGGFEHGKWAPSSGPAYLAWERLLAYLAGMSPAPDKSISASPVPPGRRLKFDVLVVGGGPAGVRSANSAIAAGRTVAMVTRGQLNGRFARAMRVEPESLNSGVRLFSDMELFGSYRQGSLLVAASNSRDEGAVIFDVDETILATGQRSIPPVVQGAHLPGVFDSHAALDLMFNHQVAPGKAVAVFGTGAQTLVAERLRDLGANVVHAGSIADLREIKGRNAVRGVDVGHGIRCDAIVHAGPWRADPSLAFQASAEGFLQLRMESRRNRISLSGSAANSDEPIHFPHGLSAKALVCPCMDVTVGEVLSHIDAGETDPEVLKRLTSCGMGPCQGFPCWENMLAIISFRSGIPLEMLKRPTHRPPRRSITVAQAAGLVDLLESDA